MTQARDTGRKTTAEKRSSTSRLGAALLKAPIIAYQWTLRPWLGWPCRHLPTCSDYALEAIDRNGPWRGGWLTLSRLCRCQPWGTHGFDPVPDIRHKRHTLMPWRYGRWTSCAPDPTGAGDGAATRHTCANCR